MKSDSGSLATRSFVVRSEPVRTGVAADETRLELLLELYQAMLTARRLDEAAAELTAQGEAFFHLACTGHEGMAALHPHLVAADWLHLHYRDKALLLARGVSLESYFHDLLATGRSTSAGRQMPPFLGDLALHVFSQNIPVGNHALQAVGAAAALRDRPSQAIVVCSLGDGASQQGEVLEAIAEAVRAHLPVLFVIEDNGYSISTRTRGQTFFSPPSSYMPPEHVFGLPIRRLDGRDVVRFSNAIGPVIGEVRSKRCPALAVVSLERLTNHTNADEERVYRSPEEREAAWRRGDPVRILESRLLARGVTANELAAIDSRIRQQVQEASEKARAEADPRPTLEAKKPLPTEGHGVAGAESAMSWEERSSHRGIADSAPATRPLATMLEAVREVLRGRLESDPRVTLHGEDIEDPKGDVFGVTRGLTRAFPGRVVNSALTESTIVGTAIGRALVGERPVAFIQFADFLPLAFNQIHAELGSMYWRTAGAFNCPVILMVACGGYRPGLGPFHAQTLESVMAHVPGVDVFMPSTAEDAAGLLQAAFDSERPTIFFYPKACLNDRDRTTTVDVDRHRVPIGSARHARSGNDLTLVAWGATVPHAERVADALAAVGVGVDLFDLRSISPWDRAAVCASAGRTGKLLVVHEDNQTCGFGAEVVATVVETVGPRVVCRRVTRPDTYVPYHFGNQLEVLPSFERLMTVACEMLGVELSWERPEAPRVDARRTVVARGPSPADQAVTVVSWHAWPGDQVETGQVLAELEADKAVFELVAPEAGRVATLLAAAGDPLRVGTPLLEMEVGSVAPTRRRLTREEPGTPIIRRREGPSHRGIEGSNPATQSQTIRPSTKTSPRDVMVGLTSIATALGSKQVSNEELVGRFPKRSVADILKRTGIASRHQIGPDESALTLAVTAARGALERSGLTVQDIHAVICSTTTPQTINPSMACLVLRELCGDGLAHEIPAYDLSAACSGFLYACAAGFDLTRSQPDARVLIVSTEAPSTLVDPNDFDTAILFGDAAAATILQGPEVIDRPMGYLRRPVLSAKGEAGRILRVPTAGTGFMHMEGLKVYSEAVRQMIGMLTRACEAAEVRPQDLDLIIPHQANARIIEDIRKRLDIPPERMYLNIQTIGNTSSASIPLCLAELTGLKPGAKIGLTAFGAGFTSGAAILELGEPGASGPNQGL